MAKKNFKSGLDDFFKDNIDEIKNVNNEVPEKEEIKKEELTENIDIENISDEKVKWLYIKLKRFEKELHLWRSGKLNLESFQESLEAHGLTYDSETNEITEK